MIPPTTATPGPGEVHVWRARLDVSGATLAEMNALLSVDERRRADAFKLDAARRRFVAARGILRQLVGGYLRRPPAQVVFSYGANGKPGIPDGFDAGRLRFNLSHSRDLGVFAFTRGRPVGVDVETLRPVPQWEAIAKRWFDRCDHERLLRLPARHRPRAFLQSWTRLEARMKTTGQGLLSPIAAPAPAPGGFDVRDLDVGPSACAAVAFGGAVEAILRFDVFPSRSNTPRRSTLESSDDRHDRRRAGLPAGPRLLVRGGVEGVPHARGH